jgi:hypothetical protein
MNGTVPKGIVLDFAAHRRRTKARANKSVRVKPRNERDELIDEIAYHLLMAAKAIQSHS